MSPRNLRGNTQETYSENIYTLKDFLENNEVDSSSRKKFKEACEAQLNENNYKAIELYNQLLENYPDNIIIQGNLNLIC